MRSTDSKPRASKQATPTKRKKTSHEDDDNEVKAIATTTSKPLGSEEEEEEEEEAMPTKSKSSHKKPRVPVSSLALASQRLLDSASKGGAKVPLAKLSQQYEKKKSKALAEAAEPNKLTPEEKRLLLEKYHQLPSSSDPEFEKKLKKLANAGVVQLMNAIQSAVKKTAAS